jgi:hypothetical protein
LPPEVPQDRLKAIEAAFQKTLRDPELIAEAERSKLNVSPISGAELRGMILEGRCLKPEGEAAADAGTGWLEDDDYIKSNDQYLSMKFVVTYGQGG